VRPDIHKFLEKYLILISKFLTNKSGPFPAASPEELFDGAGWRVCHL
jgi:hypothetical protein